jgi:hypothetical protein
MKNKPAELSAGLVAIKGAAAPSPDMPGRAGGPVVTAVPPLAPATVAPAAAPPKAGVKPPARTAKPEPVGEKEANLAPLNFRISASFKREFKTYAAAHDLKLNELLRRSFEAYRKQQRD